MGGFSGLPLDIKTIIATYDQEVWYQLYRLDHDFNAYAKTQWAIDQFIELFTVKSAEHAGTTYRLLGKLHHRTLPAISDASGYQWWYRNGKFHRDNDMPASISRFIQSWYQHGKLHRWGGPAMICTDGYRYWYTHGVYERGHLCLFTKMNPATPQVYTLCWLHGSN
jgi:hypothetical protein